LENKVAVRINTNALGDSICAIPTINKLSQAYEQPIAVFNDWSHLLVDHPSVSEMKLKEDSTEGYKIHEIFLTQGVHNNLKKHNIIDIRQFHAWDIGISLTGDEMNCDLYCEKPVEGLDDDDYVVIHPSKTWDSRTWSKDKWQELVDKLIYMGRKIIIIGNDVGQVEWNDDEGKMVSKGIIDIEGGINLVNKSTVPELRWIMNNKALCVVTMDSGVLHVAGTTDCHIVQLGSSINYKLRAPWRNGSQDYKYCYIGGSCKIFCGSDMKYGLREHDDIHGIPPLTDCREEFDEFECHSAVNNVFNHIMQLKIDDNSINLKRTEDGKPAIEVIGDYENSYIIEFIDKTNNKLLHQDTIDNNMWTCCNEIDKELLIKVNGKVFDVISKDDNILIKVNSNSLGDTIAAIPYIDKYRNDNKIDISVKINEKYVDIIKDSYPNLNYVNHENGFDKIIPINYNFYSKLQEGFALDLGYKDWEYIKPNLNIPLGPRLIEEKYAVINVHSTAQLKYWNHPKGKEVRNNALYWTELCIMLMNKGITPVIVELNEDFGVPPYLNGLPKGFIKKIGRPLKEVVNYMQHAEFFIGLSSGLAWLAHALNTKVAIIANFTDKEHEIPLSEPNYKRINNESVCNGCFNDTKNVFNSGDWEWCPEHRDTDRQFECHTSITPKQVFNEIKEWI
jgi:autotransporter strand-loop-strand O-heptosyltransferase